MKRLKTCFGKAKILIAAVALVLCTETVFAHGVQMGYCVLPNGFLRVWVEHWHGDLTPASLAGAPLSVTTNVGGTPIVQTFPATGLQNNATWNTLPGCGPGITILSSCTGLANTLNDWLYWDFPPAACNIPVTLTINAGLSAITTEACAELFPQTISAITFPDNSPPVLTCPNVSVTSCDPIAVNFNPVVVDACDPNPTVTTSIPSGAVFQIGSTTVTVIATDNVGLTDSCTFDVIVSQPAQGCNAPPIAICQNLTKVGDANCQATAQASEFDGGSIDPDNDPLTFSASPSGPYSLGVTNVVLTVSDPDGETDTCSATITVTVNSPTIVCPANIAQTTDPDTCGAIVNYPAPTASDCSGPLTPFLVSGPASGSFFPLGTTTITYGATNSTGDTATCSFIVYVSSHPNPVLTITTITAGICDNFVGVEPASPDGNLSGFVSNCFAGPPPVVGFDYLGTNRWFLHTFENLPANIIAGNLKVSAKGNGSSLNSNDGVTLVGNVDPAVCNWPVPALWSTRFEFLPESGGDWQGGQFGNFCIDLLNPPAVGDRGQSVLDSIRCANRLRVIIQDDTSIDCMTLTVISASSDTIICQPDTTLYANATTCGAPFSFDAPCSECGATQIAGPASGSTFPVGTTTVSWVMEDCCGGNGDTCSFNVTVLDTIDPTITCPATATISCEQLPDTSLTGSATATDNCMISSISYTDVSTPGACANEETITRTWTATDNHNNSSTCMQTINVVDTTPPVITVPASDLTVQCDGAGNQNEYNAWVATQGGAQATDNCGFPPAARTALWSDFAGPFSSACAGTGSQEVIFTIVDACGNPTSDTAVFTIIDTIAPTIVCPTSIVLATCDSIVTWTTSAADACSGASVVCTPPSGSAFPIGTTEVTCVATDSCGNADSCSFTVTRKAAIEVELCEEVCTITLGYGPEASAQIFVSSISGGQAPYTISWSTGEMGDTIIFTPDSTVNGDTTLCVFATVTDADGCEATIKKTIIVVDVRCAEACDASGSGSGSGNSDCGSSSEGTSSSDQCAAEYEFINNFVMGEAPVCATSSSEGGSGSGYGSGCPCPATVVMCKNAGTACAETRCVCVTDVACLLSQGWELGVCGELANFSGGACGEAPVTPFAPCRSGSSSDNGYAKMNTGSEGGVNAATVDNSFNVLPNPNNGQFTILMDTHDEELWADIQIVDLQGKVVLTRTKVDMSQSVSVDISNQPHGVYMVKVMNGDELLMRKIIKM